MQAPTTLLLQQALQLQGGRPSVVSRRAWQGCLLRVVELLSADTGKPVQTIARC